MHHALSFTHKWIRFSGTIPGGQTGYGNLRPVFRYQFWYPPVGRFFSFFPGMFLVRAVAPQPPGAHAATQGPPRRHAPVREGRVRGEREERDSRARETARERARERE